MPCYLGHERRLLASLEQNHDRNHLAGHPDVLGRPGSQDHSQRSHRAEVRERKEHSTAICECGYIEHHQLLRIRGDFLTVPDGASRAIAVAFESKSPPIFAIHI